MIDNDDGVLRDVYGYVNIKFQVGNPNKVGINGTTMQEVANLLIERLDSFQKSSMWDEYTVYAIRELEKVIDILDNRMKNRIDRGVYGEKLP